MTVDRHRRGLIGRDRLPIYKTRSRFGIVSLAELAHTTTRNNLQVKVFAIIHRSVLTLATCRRALWNYGSSVAYQSASQTDIGQFDARLNQVTERFFTLGTWRSMWKRPILKIFGHTLTIPRGFDTCRGADPVHGTPFPIYSQFHSFAAQGRGGNWDWDWSGVVGTGWGGQSGHPHYGLHLIDESAQTFVRPHGTYILRAAATEVADPGMTFIGGFDENGNELFGAINLPLVNGNADTTQKFTKLPEIQKAVTTNPVSLYSVDTTTSVATLIANYAPGETIPNYRQYSAGGGRDQQLVRAVCKLGFVPAIADNDVILPGHLGALKLGLMALSFEDKVDMKNAGMYWGPNYPDKRPGAPYGAIDLLDSEISELEEAETPAFMVDSHFGAGAVPNVR